MREIHGHETNDCNKQIRITADDQDPENGNASHKYMLENGYASHKYALDLIGGAPGSGGWAQRIRFQNGPIGVVGVNGVTNEALLAIVIDRLECFQTSKYANEFNEGALGAARDALAYLASRTAERSSRGVEGTHEL